MNDLLVGFSKFINICHVRSYLEKTGRILSKIAVFCIFGERKLKNPKNFDNHWKEFFESFQTPFSDLKNSTYILRYLKKTSKNQPSLNSLYLKNYRIDPFQTLIHKIVVNLLTFMSDIFSAKINICRDISVERASWSGRFMTEMGLGGENKLFFLYEPYS